MLRRFFLAVTFLLVLGVSTAQIQMPNLPADYLDSARRVQGDRIRLCVLQDMVLTDVNEAIAQLLGDVLLLQAVINEVKVPYHVQDLGYRSPLNQEQLFFLLNNECDGFMGYLYGVGTYPEWLTTSVPYMDTGFVLVTTNPEVTAFSQIPFGSRVGTQIGSAPNSRFLNLISNLPEGRSWRRIPYPDNRILLERVVDGTLDAALAWEPAVAAYADPTLHVVRDLQPVPTTSASFVITMISGNAYLQSSLDAAIDAVKEDGSLQELFDAHGIPATAPR